MLSDRLRLMFDEYAILSALFLPLSGQIRHRNKTLAFLSSISSAKYSFKLPVSRDVRINTRERKSSVHSKHVDITRVIVVDGELKPQ